MGKTGSDPKLNGALSISQMQTFLRCRRQWQYIYKDGILPRVERTKITTGKLIHAGFAAAWDFKVKNPESTINQWLTAGRNKIQSEFDEYMVTIEYLDEELQMFNDVKSAALEVFDRSFIGFKPEEWQPIILNDGTPAIELHFVIPCVPKKPLQGYIDLVAMHIETKQVWQIDYKFVSSMGDPANEMFSVQNPVYQYALRKLGIPTVGSITFHALNKPATMPNINKNGTISRAKINCDWLTYAQFCLDNNQNPDDYEEEMKEKLSGIEWYRANKEYRNEGTIETVWKGVIVGVGYEIMKNQRRYTRNISQMTCPSCQYMELCHGELRGYDTKHILMTSYKKRSEAVEEEEDNGNA